jgi:four helix bundle protein
MIQEKKKQPLQVNSYQFAIEIVRFCQKLVTEQKEYVLSKQILRSGTAIGALIREAESASSRADFIYKLTLSLKEANETYYWLLLLFDTDYISELLFEKLASDCNGLIYMLIASIKTAKKI